MQTTKETEVLICGAGPTGLSLALVLARHGIRFRLIDKINTPFEGSRGKGLQPRTLEIFEDLGILPAILAQGGAYPMQREYRADGSWQEMVTFEARPPTAAEPYQQPWMVMQSRTETVMRQRLAELGHQIGFGYELTALQSSPQHVDLTVTGPAGPEQWRARYVVAADGGRSVLRHLLDIGFPGKTLGARGLVADLTLTGLSRDIWHRFGGRSETQQLSLCPLAGTDLFQLQAPIAPEGDADLSLAGLSRLIAERSGRTDIQLSAVHWASAFQMNARLADRYRSGDSGRIFLAGDAAHVHPPTGGQGLNTSVQDAYNLGWKLAAVLSGADEGLLDTYEEERRPVAAGMLGLSTKLLDAARQGDMRRGREVQQLDLGYPESSLALEQPPRQQGLRAGDRAPDALLVNSSGQQQRLFELFRGAHWTLIGFHVPAVAPSGNEHLHIHIIGQNGDISDLHGHFHSAYAPAAGDWILIRPDGYIAAIVAAAHWSDLAAYLQRVGVAIR